MRFHDGEAFDSGAVRFNFERMLDPDHPFHHTGPFPLSFFFSMIEAIETPDSHTVVFHLDKPFAPFLSNLAYPSGLMVSPAALRRWGRDYGRHPAGTGPFRLKAWDSGVRITVLVNPDYWGGAPSLQAVVFRPIVDANTRMSELLAGGIDLVAEVPPDMVAVLRDLDGIEVHQQTGPHVWFLILNTRHGVFSDVRMRRAINLAIDKRALVDKVLQGTAEVAAGPIPEAFAWAHNRAVAPYPHDPERARALIKEAGYDGQTLVLLASEGGSGMLEPVVMATAIQADLAAVGVSVEIRTYEWNTYLDKVNSGLGETVDMAEMAWMTNDPDTLPYLTLRSGALPGQGGFNSGYYTNPRVDGLVERARRTTERAERARLYRDVQRIVHEDAPWAFVASWRQTAASRRPVDGFALEPSFLFDLRGVSKPPAARRRPEDRSDARGSQ